MPPTLARLNASQKSFFQGGLKGAIERGRVARRAWIEEGVVLSTADFAARHRVSPDELQALKARNELFTVDVGGEAYWPAELLRLRPEQASLVCEALAGCDDAAKLVFLIRRHGALGGQTIAEAAAQGRLEDALCLATAWCGA